MKNLKKLATLLLVAIITLFAVSCVTPSSYVVKSEDSVKIIADKDYMTLDGIKLIDYMQALKEDGVLDYTVESGMITSINGKANAVDYTSCWMLYTDDAELSNTAWGTVELDGKTYASAISGAEELTLKDGATYVWVYMTF